MSAIERLLRTIPYVRRPFFQRDAALSELEKTRAELAEARMALNGPQRRLSHRFRRAFNEDLWFILPSDDERQNQAIGDLRGYVKRSVPKAAAALEIGPSYNPILTKAEGYAVSILDHADQAALVAKYEPHGVDVAKIEPVDFVWRGETIPESIERKRFDAIVAAHMIEHAPDFIQFLDDCSQSLAAGGRLYLLVPDKRYAFDFFQPLSDTAKILADHCLKRTRHSFESFYRLTAVVKQGEHPTWGQDTISSLSYIHGDPNFVLPAVIQHTAASGYVDAHANFFTPVSFAMIVRELLYLGEIDLDLKVLTRPRGCEFLAVLQRQDRAAPMKVDDYLAWRMCASELLMVEELERIETAKGLLFEEETASS